MRDCLEAACVRGDYSECANVVANSLGLRGYHFHVVVCRLENGVAGYTVPTDFFGEVEIQLSDVVRGLPDAALAVICHEVGHQLIRRKRLEYVDNHAGNEILVDIACVYYGLGPIMMKGAVSMHSYEDRVGNTTYYVYRTAKTGYALPSQLALAYDLVALKHGKRLGDGPLELKGVVREIFRHYRREMLSLGYDLNKVRSGESALDDFERMQTTHAR